MLLNNQTGSQVSTNKSKDRQVIVVGPKPENLNDVPDLSFGSELETLKMGGTVRI